MLIALLKAYEPTWNFNHIRLTNLCSPPTLPRTKPPMEIATSTLLIIRNLHDLAPRVQAALRKYCLQTVTAKSSFLVLINVPRRPRCTPSFIHAVQVKTLESIRTTFLLGFLPDEVRDDVTFRVMALAKTEEKIVVRKVVRWLKRHNNRIKYKGKLEHLDVRSLPTIHHQTSLAHKSLGKRDTGTNDKTEEKEETGLAKPVSLSRPRVRRESTRAQEYLLLWLDIRNNWKKWRRGDETKQDEKKASRSIVTAVLQLGLDYIKEFGVTDMNPDSVKHQLEKLEDLYKDASILFGTTGEGLTLEDIRKIASLKERIEQEFPFFDRLYSVVRDSLKMVTPYSPDSRELDAASGAEQVNFHPDNEAEQSSTVDGRPIASPKLAIEHETALHGSTLKKEAARLVLPETRHKSSESDNIPASKKKPILSSKSATNLANFEKLLDGYKAQMLESKADKIKIAGREFLSLEKAAELMYQHIERMEALSVQRSEAEARRAEAESNSLLHQIQLENLKRQPEKSNEIKN